MNWQTFLLVGTLVLAAGCGGADSLNRQAVSGHVTLDGKPLSEANIRFEAAQAEIRVEAGSTVVDGRYEIAEAKGVVPGTYRVFISSLHETGETDMTMGKPMSRLTEMLPARYNRHSTLAVEVKQGHTATFDFDLNSK